MFRIDAATGVLSFVAASDFEHPADSGHDNGYAVTVRVFDGSAFDEQALTIAVTTLATRRPPRRSPNAGRRQLRGALRQR